MMALIYVQAEGVLHPLPRRASGAPVIFLGYRLRDGIDIGLFDEYAGTTSIHAILVNYVGPIKMGFR